MADEEAPLRSMELYLAEVRWRRDDQIRRFGELERKLVTTFTLNVAMIAVLSATLQLSGSTGSLPVVFEYLTYCIGFLFCINIGTSAWAYRIGRLALMPNVTTFGRNVLAYDLESLGLWTADEMVAALNTNEVYLRRRSFWTSFSLATTTFTVIAVVGAGAAALAH